MPSPKRFGTRSFGTLDVKKPPHALEDFELQVATNVDRSEAGVIKPAHNDLFQYTVQGIGNGLGVVTCSGVDYAMYADDDYVWENGTSIGVSGGDVTHRFLSDGYRRYVLNGVQNKVWDGTSYRNHGPLSGRDLTKFLNVTDEDGAWVVIYTTLADIAITSATAATGYIVATAHGMTTGDNVYCSAFAGGTWTTLNGNVYKVTVVDADTFTLQNVTTTGLGTCSAGTIRPRVCGFSGTYQYRGSLVIDFGDTETETTAQLLRFAHINYVYIEGAPTSYAITKDMVVYVESYGITDAELGAYTSLVTAAYPDGQFRVYRTKDTGNDFWLVGSDDARDGLGQIVDQIADKDLTTAYLDGFSDHSTPPTATMGVFCQQRLFLAGVSGYESRLYYSMIGNYDYFPPLNYITVVDQITALGKFGDSVVIFTPAGIKLYSPVGELGQLTDVQSSVGTTYPDSICHTGFGTLFCRQDGLWLFDGVSTTRISEPIDSLWKAAIGTWRGAYVAEHGYFTCGDDASATALEFYRVGEDILWSTAPFGSTSAGYYWQSPYIALASDPGDDFLWGMSFDGHIAKLGGESTHRTVTAKTKNFGDGTVRRWTRVYVDAETDSALTITVTTNRGQTTSLSVPVGTSAPKRFDLPINMIGEECNVRIVGTPTRLKGVWLDSV